MIYDTNPKKLAENGYNHAQSEVVKNALKVQNEVLQATGEFLRKQGFIEILPVIMSPITDPLRHATGKAEVEYYEYKYQLTRSMIFHKQIALLAHNKIFVYSPNIRLEPIELVDTGRHLAEFTQLDLEVKRATRTEVMSLGEDLLIYTLSRIKERCKKEQAFFKRDLVIPKKPFEQITYREAYNRYGGNYEVIISQQHKEPVWIIDMAIEAREFYDLEDPKRSGTLVDMDLIYPEGFGEALSGGEREYSYDSILERIKAMGLLPEDFKIYLEFAKKGIPPSAGFGIGIERLTRFICGLKRIEDVTLFPKKPGELSL